MKEEFVEIDVRETLAEGRSPLPLILNTIESLQDNQSLRLLTTWEPIPLYEMLGNLGFEHSSEQKSEELWIIDFAKTSEGSGRSDFEPPCIL
ncbi:DUF2249 domain-containing protein [Pelagicoccus sp. SDUM812003]|uniref:DUF2249 domain-containing protein n=1 Tax=Pelagicoccus sp. SDUM812003 TaxID=3041267 RepID=UPI00280D4E52|nr:DUF2249 domain-containing protein [Pelagicoccus sp. SDUM812003]MDQ8202225.1 DUF2249 domain-containing protein [Pelagicoccus sp. SDUM812003]